jgi:hypothetical protein
VRKLLVLGILLLAPGCGENATDPAEDAAINVGSADELTPATDSTLVIAGGADGAEYVLIPFYRTTASANKASILISGEGTQAPTATLASLSGGGALLSQSASASGAAAGDRVPNLAFHAALRRRERQALVGRFAAARAARAARLERSARAATGALAATTPAVGETLTINTQVDYACSRSDNRSGRVVSVSQYSIIVADVANPTGGFTDAEYAQVAAAFDSLVYPAVTGNFGAPSDVDDNGGRSIIFFSRAVNELTPVGSDWYVGGFFYGRDLFPAATCQTSNEAEIFYLLVPDPTGDVNGNVFSKAFVTRMMNGLLAHEFQHQVNLGRRIYVNDAVENEEVWLDEGLSHMAEELLFYRTSGLSPRSNIAIGTLRSSASYLDAFNDTQNANLSRLQEYLEDPEANSPYADNDSLATRGATWQFLRYAADRKGGAEASTWFALANTQRTGLANLAAVFGSDALAIVRDWTVAQYADDAVTGTPSIYQHASWAYRGIFAAYQGNNGFPLLTHSLVAGTPVRVTLAAGGAAYIRFRVPANGSALITTAASEGGPAPAGLTMTLLRTQ